MMWNLTGGRHLRMGAIHSASRRCKRYTSAIEYARWYYSNMRCNMRSMPR
jgi:hypothetical protein